MNIYECVKNPMLIFISSYMLYVRHFKMVTMLTILKKSIHVIYLKQSFLQGNGFFFNLALSMKTPCEIF